VRSNGNCRIEACRELPLEAEHHVRKDQQQCDDHRKATLLGEFAPDLRAHGLHATQIHLLTASRQCGLEPLANLAGICPLLRREPDEYVVGGAEQLHLRVRKSCAEQVRPDGFDVGGRGIADLEQDAAREVDAEIQAAGCERHQ
jgi:hypothetical protein